MDHLERLRQNLNNSLIGTKANRSRFCDAAGISDVSLRSFLAKMSRTQPRTLAKIEAEMRRRGWLETSQDVPSDSVEAPQPHPTSDEPASEPPKELPFPEVTEMPAGSGPEMWKWMANTLVHAKSFPHNKGKEEEIDKEIEKFKKEATRPQEGYQYDSDDLYDANPVYKLTSEEKLYCIRTLPIPIVNKLFPHL